MQSRAAPIAFWQNFLYNAEEACANGGQHAANHFVDAGKTTEPFYMQARTSVCIFRFLCLPLQLELKQLRQNGRTSNRLQGFGRVWKDIHPCRGIHIAAGERPRELSAHTCRNLHEQGYAGNEDAHSVATLRHCPFAGVVGAVFQQGEREDEHARCRDKEQCTGSPYAAHSPLQQLPDTHHRCLLPTSSAQFGTRIGADCQPEGGPEQRGNNRKGSGPDDRKLGKGAAGAAMDKLVHRQQHRRRQRLEHHWQDKELRSKHIQGLLQSPRSRFEREIERCRRLQEIRNDAAPPPECHSENVQRQGEKYSEGYPGSQRRRAGQLPQRTV